MPDSPSKQLLLLPQRPDTRSLHNLIENMPAFKVNTPEIKPKRRTKKLDSPTAKKFKTSSSQNTLNNWISKKTCNLLETSKISNTTKQKSKKCNKTKNKSTSLKETSNLEKPHDNNHKNSDEKCKKSSKPTFSRFNSASSDELPSFKDKIIKKRGKQTDALKKYGVIVPSLDEIEADQKNFSNYKIQVEEAQTIKEPAFKIPVTPEKLSQSEEVSLLDCKHLTLEEITAFFKTNISFLLDILNGKKFSERHRRYFNKKNNLDIFTTKDLTYNTSTIVFTFEQLDHMVSLMQSEFDPEDKKTVYFFKVLVPELCLKLFMETHNMNKREANAYLEKRPID